MILVIENRAALDSPAPTPRAHECSLQLTLRRLGFYAARPAPKRRRLTTPTTDRTQEPHNER